MEELWLKHQKKVAEVSLDFIRDFMDAINWNDRLIGIKGARGVGKTTLLLQYVKTRLVGEAKALYVSLDDFYFKRNRLYDMAGQFVRTGGHVLLLDEVHRYKDWSQELKNLYDDYPELKIIFTGSSIIHLSKSRADLSRRAVLYHLHGLSFREFLRLQTGFSHPAISLADLIAEHETLAAAIDKQIKPLQFLQDYLQLGYYPYFLENKDTYLIKLAETVGLLLETDFPAMYDITYPTVDKIKMFLAVIAESVPFKPNIQKLSEQIGLTRNMLVEHLHNLEDADLLHLLHRKALGATRLQKPDKVFLANTNLAYALNFRAPDIGTLRETFFISQTRPRYQVEYAEAGDFWVDHRFAVEVGGRDKGYTQLPDMPNALVAADDLAVGYARKVPLWLFGFLY